MKHRNKDIIQCVVLDSCILQYLSNAIIASQIIDLFRDLSQRGFVLSISDFSIFESLCNTTTAQEKEIFQTLNIFPKFACDQNIFVTASQLSMLYQKERTISQAIEIGDKIISATSILSNSLIITANINDFPRPFFVEAEVKKIFYTKKRKQNLLVIYILSPDYEVVHQRFAERQ